jgi:trehalose 6-phosphate synthase
MSSRKLSSSPSQVSILAKQVIIASNRGPVEYSLNENNTLSHHNSSGGVAIALIDVALRTQATWVAAAVTSGDRIAASKAQKENDGVLFSYINDQRLRMRYVIIPESVFRRYYDQFSNEQIWVIQHYMYSLSEGLDFGLSIEDSWENGYCVANQAIADAICSEVEGTGTDTAVLLHDYHLYLIASLVRKRYPSILIQHFLHSAWPDVRYLYFLPSHIVEGLYEGLVGNDLLGFQTEQDARNFLEGASAVLEGAEVNFEEQSIIWNEHCTHVRTYPTSISVVGERYLVESDVGKLRAKEIQPFLDKKIIMRVDRMDPTKNIVRGFRAYAQLLHEHPELLGRIVFLAFLVPTRESTPSYQRHKAEVFRVVEEINIQFGTEEWVPIHVFYGNDRIRALAAMQYYDVLLVNPIFDGMNLVAKEGPAVNQRDGVLVLSRTIGAFPQLADAAIPISPLHIPETVRALYKALTLSPEERSAKAKQAKQEVEQHDLHEWLNKQIGDINTLLSKRSALSGM